MAVTQLPASTVVVGFDGAELTMMIRSTQDVDSTGNLEYVTSEAGDDAVAVVSNQGVRQTLSGVLKNGQTAPAIGDIVTTTATGGGSSTKWIVESSKVSRGPTVARVSLTIYKPNATTWQS